MITNTGIVQSSNPPSVNASNFNLGNTGTNTLMGSGGMPNVKVNVAATIGGGGGATIRSLPVLGGLASGNSNSVGLPLTQGQMMSVNVNNMNTRSPYSSLDPNVNGNINMNASGNFANVNALQMQMAFNTGGTGTGNTNMNGNGGAAASVQNATFPQTNGLLLPVRGVGNVMTNPPGTLNGNANAPLHVTRNIQGVAMNRMMNPNIPANQQAQATLYWNAMKAQQGVITNPPLTASSHANLLPNPSSLIQIHNGTTPNSMMPAMQMQMIQRQSQHQTQPKLHPSQSASSSIVRLKNIQQLRTNITSTVPSSAASNQFTCTTTNNNSMNPPNQLQAPMKSMHKAQISLPIPSQNDPQVRHQPSKSITSEEVRSHENISTLLLPPPLQISPPYNQNNITKQHEGNQNNVLRPLTQREGQEQKPEEKISVGRWNSYLQPPTPSNKILPVGIQSPSRGLETVDLPNRSLQKPQEHSSQYRKDKNNYVASHEQNCALKSSSKQSNHKSMKHINVTKEKELCNKTANGHIQTSWNDKHKNFLEGNLTGGWQTNKDLDDRSKIIYNIVNLFKQTRPKTDTEYHK